MRGLAALAGYGFALGWSVAWPPGPINAEMIRRGLAAGFRPAFAVGLGACSADGLWAIAVMLGIGLVVGPGARFALALASTGLLLLLAALFLAGAWRAWHRHRVSPDAPATRFVRARGGYMLGLGMALTSPWNLAFWLAVMGRPQSLDAGVAGALTIAGAVLLGAGTWCLVLCGMVVRLHRRLGALWQIVAQSMTGILMLAFAAAQAWTLLHV
jgi:threonine/homoserine/homoserine lactone efflux protein